MFCILCSLKGYNCPLDRTESLQDTDRCWKCHPFGMLLPCPLIGMLMMKLKDMRMGTFKGMTALDKKAMTDATAMSLGLSEHRSKYI